MSHPIQTPNDPFTLAMLGLWEQVVNAHDPLTELVKPGNQIMRIGKERSVKFKRQDADTPELDLFPVGIDEPVLFGSSTSVRWTQIFEFAIFAGARDLSAAYHQVKWELLRALAIAGIKSQSSIDQQFNLGFDWILKIDIVSHADEPDDPARARNRQGWVGLLDVGVLMNFDRQRHILADVPELAKPLVPTP